VDKVRRFTDIPIGVGFGISNAAHVAEAANFADGVAVGSALINALASGDPSGAAERAGAYIKSLVPGTPRKVVAN
jgi:tryptophan synthase alpha chain